MRRDIILNVVLGLGLFLAFVPVLLMLFMSVRSTGQILTKFWSLPRPVLWANYPWGWEGISPYIANSVLYSTCAVVLVVVCSSLSGYALATMQFPGKEMLFVLILALMMIPGVLTLFPRMSLIYYFKLVDTMWALILPWAAGGQIMGVMLMRISFEGIHPEMREAARVDGATELQILYRVCLPIVWPMAVTLAIMNFVGTYNDFIWPLIIIHDRSKQVVAVGLREFVPTVGATDLGPQMAAYVLASIPMLLVFLFGMKYYIAGITSGALKA